MTMWPIADQHALREFAIQNAFNVPDDLEKRAMRSFPNGWAVALSVNR